MNSADSITVIVPARNEARELAHTAEVLRTALTGQFAAWEIVIVNDGSHDRTGAIADALRAADARIRVIHRAQAQNIGAAFRDGAASSAARYITMINAKNVPPASELARVWAARGTADMIIPYALNRRARPWLRRAISRAFVLLLNLLFGLRLRYYNHYVLHQRALAARVPLRTSSYACQAELIIRLLRRGHTYREVGIRDNFNDLRPSRAFSLHNLTGVATFVVRMLADVHGDEETSHA
jgi:dolichol-phosphate mannosyltransferase